MHSTVAGSIGVYDLPDLAASLAPSKLLIEDVTDGNGNDRNTKEINEDLKVTRDAYKVKGKNQLQILPTETGEGLNDSFKNWLEN